MLTKWIPDWLTLIRKLSDRFPDFIVFKNAAAAIAGMGDIDAVAPTETWDAIADEFDQWAGTQGLESVIQCRHFHNVLFLAALDREHNVFWELDLLASGHFRGSVLFQARDLKTLSVMDEQGFRRLRPGAEGLLLLLTNGMRWGGRKNNDWLAKGSIQNQLRQDPDGVRELAQQLGMPVKATLCASSALAEGGWNRRALAWIELWSLARAALDPQTLLHRPAHRYHKRACPLLNRMFYNDRRIPRDANEWLCLVSQSTQHTVSHRRKAAVTIGLEQTKSER